MVALNFQSSNTKSLLKTSAIFQNSLSISKLRILSNFISASSSIGTNVAYQPAHKNTVPKFLSIFLSSSISHFLLAICPLLKQSLSKSTLFLIRSLNALINCVLVYLSNSGHIFHTLSSSKSFLKSSSSTILNKLCRLSSSEASLRY